jgi:hypothetical protein
MAARFALHRRPQTGLLPAEEDGREGLRRKMTSRRLPESIDPRDMPAGFGAFNPRETRSLPMLPTRRETDINTHYALRRCAFAEAHCDAG